MKIELIIHPLNEEGNMEEHVVAGVKEESNKCV